MKEMFLWGAVVGAAAMGLVDLLLWLARRARRRQCTVEIKEDIEIKEDWAEFWCDLPGEPVEVERVYAEWVERKLRDLCLAVNRLERARKKSPPIDPERERRAAKAKDRFAP